MIAVTLADLAAVVDGRLTPDADPAATVTGSVVVDSRLAGTGSLFVCLPGEQVDGHVFATDATERGAVAAVAAHDVAAPAVIVADPLAALGQLAAASLHRLPDCVVIGVTGSTGKTTTKDLLAQIFERVGPTIAPQNSFNNEIGLPLTVLRADELTRTLVCEFSARGVGHIRYLCSIARPRVGVVLNVGAAHLGEFGSRDAIAAAKGELVESLPSSGAAVLNNDDALVVAMRKKTSADVLTFGVGNEADVHIADLRLDNAARPSFLLQTPDGNVRLQLQLAGAHHAANAAAATGAALAADVDLATIAAALESATLRSAHRLAMLRRPDGLRVIDDAYNANPESMVAAIEALVATEVVGRRWAVFGEMRELGDESLALHRQVGSHAAARGVDEVVAVGPAAAIADGATTMPGWSGQARTVADTAAATTLLHSEVAPDDVVLIKASNSLRFWTLAEELVSGPETAAASEVASR